MTTNKIQIIVLLIIILISIILCDINIHIIPHTHMDPGWLKTPEEYYSDENIAEIFNTVLNELSMKHDRTFVINEIYYFKIWYSNLNEDEKMKCKELIKQKRIEFVSGSYTINDEATPLYYNIADQIRIGHQFLLEEFGILPKTGWYIDSFGHSAGNAHVLAQLNFDYLVLGRMHVDFLDVMKNNHKTEFYWEPFGKNNSNKKILTHVLPLHYGYTFFLTDLELGHDDFNRNIRNIVDNFINNVKSAWEGLKHNNIMFLYGDDFKHKDNTLLLNIDSLINAFNPNYEINNQSLFSEAELKMKFNTNDKINIFYSTPEKYFDSVKKELAEKNLQLDSYINMDFYPLRTDCYWTGYFTSRPYLKGYIRKSSNIFYTFSKYHSFNMLLNENIDINIISNLNSLREAVGLTQHHDAITGTCMQYVSSDYIQRLKNGITNVENDFTKNIENTYQIKIGKICYNNYISDHEKCSDEFYIGDNGSTKEIEIGIYNPTNIYSSSSSDSNNLLINIEILDSENVYEIDGIKSDFFCINDKTIKNHKLFNYKNKCFLNFFYQFKENEELIFLTLKKTSENIKTEKYKKFKNDEDTKLKLIKNEVNIQSLVFYPKTFEFDLEYYNEDQQITKINFTYYDGMYYVNAGECTDGAYIFSPYNKYPDRIDIDYNNSFYYKGDLGITFVTRNYMASFTVFTIFYNPFFVKVEHYFDTLEKSYFFKRFSFGYSFVLKTNINNLDIDKKPIFYTDANGLEVIKRTIDKYEYKENAIPWTGGNFYPVTSFISIQDENNEENKKKVTIFNDRSQGGTGYLPGSLILILQRMSYAEDHRGLIESLYEVESMNNDDFKTTHLIVFGTNIYKNKGEGNINKYMMQKTDLINFIYNYMNVGTSIFKIIEKNNSMENNIIEKVKNNNKLKSDKIDKYIKISPDIRANYELINSNLIIGEYFRYNNYFLNKINNNENNDTSFGKISLNFDYDTKFKIYIDKTGINYSNNDRNIIGDEVKNKLVYPKNQILSLQNNEFLYIYFYFERNLFRNNTN